MATKCFKVKATLIDETEDSQAIISRFGRSRSGLIVREFIVREDMPLYALHYALEKAFGFLNEHLHSFELKKEDFANLIKDSSKIYREYVGVLFKSPARDENEDFWCDNYHSGSFENWRKKKYKPPFIYNGLYPTKEDWQNNLSKFINDYDDEFVVTVDEENGFRNAFPAKFYKNTNIKVKKENVYSFDDLPIHDLEMLFQDNINTLLDTLTIKEMFEKYKSFIYLYDFGDNWEFNIEISDDVKKEDEDYVNNKKLPKMVSYDGLNLVEDIGGIDGYCRFLYSLYNLKEVNDFIEGCYETEDNKYYIPIHPINSFDNTLYLEPNQIRRWAYSLEWKEYFPDLESWF